MTRLWLTEVAALFLVVFAGCKTAPKREERSRAPQITLSTTEPSPSRNLSDACGLNDFPVSKTTQEILASALRDGVRPPNQMMVAKVAINAEGAVTHVRVLRLAWPKLPNSYAINEQAVDSIKRWRYRPTIVGGKPVAVCSEVSVTVDLE